MNGVGDTEEMTSQTSDAVGTDPAGFRMHVVAESIRLFAENGYESTTVEQIALAAGVSRRTLFRQFRSKEDVIFADHESLLDRTADRLAGDTGDAWLAVCSAAESVFAHFSASRPLAVRRFRVVQGVAALRDRELVTTYRYQRLFEEYLRGRLPGESRVRIAAYVAAVTGAHNYLLRSMVRGDPGVDAAALHRELMDVYAAFHTPRPVTTADAGAPRGAVGAASGFDRETNREVTVVTYPSDMAPSEVARRVTEHLTHQGD